MRKVVLFILLFCLVGCSDNSLYESIEPSIEDVTTVEEYIALIDIAREYEFKYFYFIDLRSSVKYNDKRLSHFKVNFDYSKESSLSSILRYIGDEKNSYIILISETDDNLSLNAKNDLIESGYTNIKNISIGINEFENLLIELDLKDVYMTSINCGC